MTSFNYKIYNELLPRINKIQNIRILELGVQKGRSTLKFLNICKKNNGKLFSVDVEDCSEVSNDPEWTFIKSRDDNFVHIKSIVKEKIDILFIDTIHEALHVKNIIEGYYDIVKEDGYIFIDDISHLPYVSNAERDNFYCEINNEETFDKILEIYLNNKDNFDLNFSLISSGLAILKKKNNNQINAASRVPSRKFSVKNMVRYLWKKIKKNL